MAIVTGSSQGIGRAIALGLAELGCRVVICGRTPKALEDTASTIQRGGGSVLAVRADLSVTDEIESLIQEAVDAYGDVHILVNNVGGSFGEGFKRGLLLDLTEEDVSGVLRLNVLTPFLCSRSVVPHMRRHGQGSIVNISSVLVRTPMPEFGAYTAAKAAVTSLTETMAIEWAPEIRVNSLLVGHVDTERARRNRSKDDIAWLQRHISLGRLGSPSDIAGAVAYLSSPLSAWVTGAAIAVDGGARAL